MRTIVEGVLIIGLTQIGEITLPVNGKPPLNFTYGFFDFNVLGVDPGGSVTITIAFPDNIPMNCQYWKYNNGWVNVTSLVGDNDGDNIITLTLTDGGFEDADGLINGRIRDPGGIGFLIQTPIPSPATTPIQPAVTTMISTTRHGASMPATTAPAPMQLPNLLVQSASLSAFKVIPGTPVTVTANVANRGTVNGSTKIKVYVNGEEDSSLAVTVESGGSRQVYFTVSRSQPGTYHIYIGGTQAGIFTVEETVDPNIILLISCMLIITSIVLSVIYVLRRRQYEY